MNSNTLVQKQKAIYTALSKFFKGEQLLDFILDWDKNFSKQPAFALNTYISGFIKQVEPIVSRTELFQEIIFQMKQPEDLLLDIPEDIASLLSQSENAKSAQSENNLKNFFEKNSIEKSNESGQNLREIKHAQAESSPKRTLSSQYTLNAAVHIRVFELFMNNLIENLPTRLQESARLSIIKNVNKMKKIDSMTKQDLVLWISGENSLKSVTLTIDRMKDILGFFYVISCDLIGPVESDLILSRQAKKIQATPDGIKFSPYNIM